MWRVLIADDEPKIRRGLQAEIRWQDFEMEVCGLAANGAEALEKIRREKYDLCLIDVNMPILNGLDLIRKIHEYSPDIICIIISGYDDFSYAKQALEYGVFGYLLKPIKEDKLYEYLLKAENRLKQDFESRERMRTAQAAFRNNEEYLRECFIREVIRGRVLPEEMEEACKLYHLKFPKGVHALKIVCVADRGIYDQKLLAFAIRNVTEEILGRYEKPVVVSDPDENILALSTIPMEQLASVSDEIVQALEYNLKCRVEIKTGKIQKLIELAALYEEWAEDAAKRLSEMVGRVKKRIDQEYTDPDLSVQDLASRSNINVSYLSRQFREEMGVSPIEYIGKVRIVQAIRLLENTDLRIYEIAEQVGYRSQHYFCTIFKKVLGISPTEFRQSKKESSDGIIRA